MKVEIWSDVMCPFCYIGKRKFESALKQFEHADQVEVVWKSFQLNPDMKTDPSKSINDYLSEVKGWSREQAAQANAQVTAMAAEAGLEYHLDKSIVANSFNAHQLIQLAKKHGKGDAVEELLFKYYFTDSRNIDDLSTLLELAAEAGLDREEASAALEQNSYAKAVEQDIYESRQVGLRGVPHFVFNDKFTISGAQPDSTFLGALRQSYQEWQAK